MGRFLALLAAFAAFLPAASRAATLDGIAVEVTNASEPVLCAEKDNVTIKFTSPEVRRFRIRPPTRPISAGSAGPARARLHGLRGSLARHHRGAAAAPGHLLRGRRDLADRHDLRQFLAPARRAVPGRRPGRARPARGPALGAARRARRRGARDLPGRRLLAHPPAAAGPYALERLRLLVPGRSGRDGGASGRQHQGDRLRSRRR